MLLLWSESGDNVVSCFGIRAELFEKILDADAVELESFGVAVVVFT